MIQEKRSVILVGDFNCRKIDWEKYENGGGEETWGGRFLNLMIENMMEQRVKENTRYRGDDEPAMLDLILTREIEMENDIRYKCPLGKSDHLVLEMDLVERNRKRDETYKKKQAKLQKGGQRRPQRVFYKCKLGENDESKRSARKV